MKSIIIGAIVLGTSAAWAESPIQVEIKELSNLRGNAGLEACGTAVHSAGIKPLLVTIKHDASAYTTLTDQAGAWCQVIKRWTYDGKIQVSAATLDFKDVSAQSTK